MKLYRSSYVLDEDACRELAPLCWSRGRTWLHWAAAAGMGALALVLGRTACRYALCFLVLAVCFAPTPGMGRAFCQHIVRTRLYESSPCARIESFFTEEGIFVHNLATCGQSMIRYQAVRQAAETEHYFFLRLKPGRWYTVVSKECLTQDEINSFLPFLLEKCPKLKGIR